MAEGREAVKRCMECDESTYRKVPMKDIYLVTCQDSSKDQKTVADRVLAWEDRRFYNISDEETSTPEERK